MVDTLQIEEVETIQFPFNAVETVGVPALLGRGKRNWCHRDETACWGALRNKNLALRFILEYTVTTVIPGMDSLEQVEENAGVGIDLQPLTAAERKTLEEEVNKLGGAFCSA